MTGRETAQHEREARLAAWHRILCQRIDFANLFNDETRELDGSLLHSLEQAIRPFTAANPLDGMVWTPPYPTREPSA